MPQTIQRTNNLPGYDVICATAVADSTTVSMGAASSLAVFVPTNPGPGRQIDWYGSYTPDGPWVPIFLSGEEAAYTAIQGEGLHVAPPDLFACSYIRGICPQGQLAVRILMKG